MLEIVTDPQSDWSSSGFDGAAGAGTVSETDEFVELYIKTAGLDLAGWTISLEDTSPFSGDLTGAGAFQTARYVGAGSFHATAAGDYLVLGNPQASASLNNEILIVLKDDQDNVIDQVQVGSGGAPDGDATDRKMKPLARPERPRHRR